ncbi:hypothetical protein BDQ17DRAFT_1329205 [Cyathus striatus]|nr:hypothetical protein BDQ17DRAFT_1329205 [Cyathus striatus]
MSTTSFTTNSTSTSTLHMAPQYILVGLPPPAPFHASRDALQQENANLHKLLEATTTQIQCDYAQKQLMDAENAHFQSHLYGKETKQKQIKGSGHPWHLTSEESLKALAKAEWQQRWKELLCEAMPYLKEKKRAIVATIARQKQEEAQAKHEAEQQEKEALKKKKLEEEALEKIRRAEEQKTEKQRREEEQKREREEHAAEKKRKREEEKQRIVQEREEEKQRKEKEREVEKKRKEDEQKKKAEERRIKAAESAAEKALKTAGTRKRTTLTKGKSSRSGSDKPDNDTAKITHHVASIPRPKPHPIAIKHQVDPDSKGVHANTPADTAGYQVLP